MFGYPGDDSRELRAQYDFGPLESATNRGRLNTAAAQQTQRQDSDDVVVPEDVHVADVQNSEAYSPQEGDGSNHYGEMPVTPMAFGSPEDGTAPGAMGTGTSTGVTATGGAGKAKKGSGKAAHVVKEVLGMNKKSTKGKTDDEKAQISLAERWKTALAEEERLNALSQQVVEGEERSAVIEKQPNLPRKFLCIHPLVYHSIATEVPSHRQRFVTIAWWNWVAVCILLLLNCGIAVGVGFAPYKDAAHKEDYPFNKALNTVLAIVYLIGAPFSFVLWYWRVYRGCSTGRPAQHLVALFGLIIGLAWALFAFVGPRTYGVCGIDLAVHIGRSRQTGVVAPVAFMILLWLAEAGMMCYLIVQEWIFYRKDLGARRAARNAIKSTVASP